MRIVFMRHGIAVDGAAAASDELRPLTEEGRERVRKVARGLRTLDCRPRIIVSSPLVRARETAEIVAELLAPKVEVQELDSLRPGGNFAEFMSWVEQQDAEEILAVGHMPDIAEFAQRCLTGRVLFSMTFKKAAACLIEFDGEPAAGRGCLEWLIQPGALRQLG
ncbi:MAG: phosphohistidine phosphatase SixA [Kiritimatiellae bacterium]|nr:phosphohistidine phosphatase SixA [Kiritimatiellia bacterium]